jgi:hypothetical protein
LERFDFGGYCIVGCRFAFSEGFHFGVEFFAWEESSGASLRFTSKGEGSWTGDCISSSWEDSGADGAVLGSGPSAGGVVFLKGGSYDILYTTPE